MKRLLIFFGGTDESGYTLQAVEQIARAVSFRVEVDVIAGGANPRLAEIRDLCHSRDYSLHVQTNRVAELMLEADLAIGAGGSATWERCCVGLPTIAYAVADNQLGLLCHAARCGLIYAPNFALDELHIHLDALIRNPLLLQGMSQRGMSTVDGHGTSRVLRDLGVSSVRMRAADASDAANIFEWRNHHEVRAVSRSAEPISLDAHTTWFSALLDDPRRALLIGELEGAPVGVVRFDEQDGKAEVSIYLVPGFSGQGLGAQLLGAAETWLVTNRPAIRAVTAEVRGGNERSQRLFLEAGYHHVRSHFSKRLS